MTLDGFDPARSLRDWSELANVCDRCGSRAEGGQLRATFLGCQSQAIDAVSGSIRLCLAKAAPNECTCGDRHGDRGGSRTLLGARGARMHGGCVRRHRHEPALHPQRRRKVRQSDRAGLAGGRARHRVADLLVADHRHLDQIRDPHHARRQPRRGRHPGAACARQPAARQAQHMARRNGRGRPRRGDAPLRRRHDHARRFRS